MGVWVETQNPETPKKPVRFFPWISTPPPTYIDETFQKLTLLLHAEHGHGVPTLKCWKIERLNLRLMTPRTPWLQDCEVYTITVHI